MAGAPNNGRVINCSENARKLEVMDVVSRARAREPDASNPPDAIARMILLEAHPRATRRKKSGEKKTK